MNPFLSNLKQLLDDQTFSKIIFTPNDVEFRFKEDAQNLSVLETLFVDHGFDAKSAGKILTVSRISKSKEVQIFESYQDLFSKIYDDINLPSRYSCLIID